MAEDKKISQLNLASAFTGAEKFELVQGGLNVAGTPEQMKNYIGGVTREFNRAWDTEIVFDKNEIDYAPHELSSDLEITVASLGHLVNEFSVAIQTIITDGSHSVTFTGFAFIHGANNGDIPDAGTYQIYYMYRNGISTVYFGVPSSEEANLTPLAAPGSFAAVVGTDPETEIDLSWADVANESSYLIQVSLNGTTGWSDLNAPAAGTTSYTHTGLSAGSTRFYRIKAVGDGVTFADSAWSTTSAMTESGGDAGAPVATFAPLSGVTDWPINQSIVITLDEAIRNDDGSPITSNQAGIIVLKETNSGGADIPHTWVINGGNNQITITPDDSYGGTQLVYWAIDGIEDVNGNEAAVQSSTFTTSDYTVFNGTSNRLQFGDVLDSLFAAADTNFWLEVTIKNHTTVGVNPLVTKYTVSGDQRAFSLFTNNSDIYFVYWMINSPITFRQIKWAGAFDTGEQTIQLRYNGALDTNDGRDRVELRVNGGVQGSKTLDVTSGTLNSSLANTTSYLAVGAYVNSGGTPSSAAYFNGELKDFIIRSNNGTVVEVNVPLIAEGTDTSGNGVNGTWV